MSTTKQYKKYLVDDFKKDKLDNFTIRVGKHKGRKFIDLANDTTKECESYNKWVSGLPDEDSPLNLYRQYLEKYY